MDVTYEQVRLSEEIRTYIKQADESLDAIGYTEHSFAHCTKVAKIAGDKPNRPCTERGDDGFPYIG